MKELTRRDFLGHSLLGAVAAPGLLAAAGNTAASAWPHLEDTIVINNLGFLANPNQLGYEISKPVTHIDKRTIEDALASSTTAVNVTIGYVAGTMEPFEYSVNSVATWNRIIRDNPEHLLKVWTTDDIHRAKKKNKVGIIMGFQNSLMLGDRAERASIFANLGVKVIQLTYNIRNKVGDGSMMIENRGLTKFGHEVVEALNDNNTLIDLSHSGEQTCLDAIQASNQPVAITHTGCRALADTPRNKTDKELRLLADKGGFVGIYFMPFLKENSFPDAVDIVHHIEHAIKVCGEDHVGIGTDGLTTGVDDMRAYQTALQQEYEMRQQAGIAAKGEKPGVTPFIPGIQGPGQFQQLADMLYARGHTSSRIEKILGRNSLRLFDDVWV